MYDVIVCGGGAAGLTAGMYTARAGLKTLIFGSVPGGQTLNAHLIENYPGVPETDGFSLMDTFRRQAEAGGAEYKMETVSQIDLEQKTVNGVRCKAIILAMGSAHLKLKLEGEDRLVGKGVSYCAACDGHFFRNKTVTVVGGGNTAVADAIYLSNICKRVFLVHRRDSFRAEKALVDKLMLCENVECVLNSSVCKLIEKDGKLGAVRTENREIECDGLFVAIGSAPSTELVADQLAVSGGIAVNAYMETGTEGVFAAGDVTNTNHKQIITAAGDGAKAAKSAIDYLQKKAI